MSYCLNDGKLRHFKTELIGLTNDTCKCLNQIDLNRLRNVADSRCDHECSEFDIDRCGGTHVVSIYRVYEDSMLTWAKKESSQGQCIYVKLKGNGEGIKSLSTSCFTVKVNGYFCQIGMHGQLDGKCSIRENTSRRLCLANTLATRQAAKEACLTQGGALADLSMGANITELMKNKSSYWLGVHRAYTVTETRNAFSTECLAVTKVNRTLRLDPDNFNKKKFFFCEATNSIASRVTSTSVTGLGRSDLHIISKSPKSTAKRINSSDTSLHTTVKRVRTERTKEPVSNQDKTTAQTPYSTSGIPKNKFETTLNYKTETAVNIDISETLLSSRTNLVTEKPVSHSEGLSHTSSSKSNTGLNGIGNNISDYPQSTVDNKLQDQFMEITPQTSADTGNSEQESTASITQDSSNGSNSDALNVSPMSNMLYAVAGAVLVIVVVVIIIIVKKKCHRSDKFNSIVKQVPKEKINPYCIAGEDSVMHAAEFTKQSFATFYTNKPSTQSVVYDEPEGVVKLTSFKPAKRDELENHQYDRIKINYKNANAVCEAFETRYETGIGLNTYDHGVNFPKTNPNNSNYYVLERKEQ